MKKNRRFLKYFGVMVAILAVLAVGAYVNSRMQLKRVTSELKAATVRDFHDPDSARFRSVRLQSLQGSFLQMAGSINAQFLKKAKLRDYLSFIRHDPELLILCGEVNAKNRFGAYVGYKVFYISYDADPRPFLDSDDSDFASRMCEIGDDSIVYRTPDE